MDKKFTPPPTNFGNKGRNAPVVKPKNMKGTLARLLSSTAGNRKGLGWIFILAGLASGSVILSPYVVGKAIDSIDKSNKITLLLILLALVYVCDWLIRFLQQYFMATVSQRLVLFIRKKLFFKMKKLPLSFYDTRRHGELMSRLTNDIDNISSTISDSLAQLMMLFFTVTGVLAIMIYLNVVLTLVTLISVVLVFVLTKTVTSRTKKLFKEQQATLGRLNGQIEEGISGLSAVKAFCREEEMQKQFEAENEKLRRISTKALIWSGYLMPLMNVINNLSFVFVATVSGIMAANGYISIAIVSSFLLYSRQLTRPFVEVANIYNNFQTAVAGAERIFEIFDETPEPADKENALVLTSPKGEVEFIDVEFGYTPQKQVLKSLNLKIPAGTRTAVVGETGAGKTTIISLLTRFYDVTGGKILLDGKDLRDYTLDSLRSSFGVVLQDTALFDMSVKDNISYGNSGVPFEKIQEAAVMAGADAFIKRLPQGYDTVIGEGGATLSQGERQLITIARAILADAPILILDEATSSVDTMTEQKIRNAMLTVTKGRTSFIIAHRLSTIRDSDLIILLDNGKIAEMGSHNELMQLNGRYSLMYKTQTGKN